MAAAASSFTSDPLITDACTDKTANNQIYVVV